jgi:hypothetical protein
VINDGQRVRTARWLVRVRRTEVGEGHTHDFVVVESLEDMLDGKPCRDGGRDAGGSHIKITGY